MSVTPAEGAIQYVSQTCASVSARLKRDVANGTVDVAALADDVAWLARQVGRLADLRAES